MSGLNPCLGKHQKVKACSRWVTTGIVLVVWRMILCAIAAPINACPGVGLSRFLTGRKMPRRVGKGRESGGVRARGIVDEKPVFIWVSILLIRYGKGDKLLQKPTSPFSSYIRLIIPLTAPPTLRISSSGKSTLILFASFSFSLSVCNPTVITLSGVEIDFEVAQFFHYTQ